MRSLIRLATLWFLTALPAGITLAQTAPVPEWIWFHKTDEAETRYFRKAISIEGAAGSVTQAELVATADDALEVFVNGERVLSAEEWPHGHTVSLPGKFKPGPNVVAIRALNGDSSPAGTVLQLTLTTGNGRQIVVSDASWKAAEKAPKDWAQPGFDDSAWATAQSLGRLGMDPWGPVFNNRVAGSAKPLGSGSGGGGAARVATPAEQLAALPGFRVELLHSGEPAEGSWVNLCRDPKGRLVISPQYAKSNPDGGLLRVTLDDDGRIAKREFIARPLYDAQGMRFANGALWVVVNKYNTHFESGLYRITDDGSDTWPNIELIRKLPGGGEHGPHAVELGPDGNLWVMAGNHT
ncbi:MAG: hypothetical protein KIT22_17600, partial [Verrucomicrobiae bacterium]|nr:hypothetical protein [Verrucomicrobiae bacterium]